MHMYLDLMSEIALLKFVFIVVKSDLVVPNSPRWYIIFTPAVSLVLIVYVFCVLVSQTNIT